MPPSPTHRDIYGLIAALDTKLDGLSDRIGHEETGADGTVTGTGLTGRLIRTETKVLAYDQLKERVIGALAAGTVAIGVLWWLVKAKVASVFGVQP